MKMLSLLLACCVALTLTACSNEESATTAKPATEPVEKAASAAVEQAKQVAQQASDKVEQVATQVEEKANVVVAKVKEALASGETIYSQACVTCHKMGVMGAPKVGDKEAWSALLAGGQQKMVDNAIKGIGRMPAKGGVSSLSDEEVAAAVEYMVEQSR
ncbi:MAG TPA: c-type cytochrome [Malonomonas sp.]